MVKRVAGVVLCALVTAAAAPPPSPVDAARAALQRHDDAAAVATLEAFLATAKVDPRRAEARALLVRAAGGAATAAEAKGDADGAVATLVAAAKAIDPDPRAAELAGRAKRLLRAAYAGASKQKAYGRGLWAVTTYAAAFPADPPLATETTVQVLRAGAAGEAIGRQGPAAAYATVRGLVDADRVPVAILDRHGVDRAAVTVAYAGLLRRAGWDAQAAAVAGATLADGGLTPAGRAAVAAARSAALVARADACLAFGDRAMAVAAVADVADAVDGADGADGPTAARLRAALDALLARPADPEPSIGAPPADPPATAPVAPPATAPAGPKVYVPFQDLPAAPPPPTGPTADGPRPPATAAARGPAPVEPVPLPAAEPFEGEQAWVDGGSGYTLGGRVARVGNSNQNHGGTWAAGHVHLRPGFVLADGTLVASGGDLHLDGTADRPVVLRRVRIDCEYTAAVTATFAIFDDCTFTKTGPWHWNAGHNSKWTLSDCLLVGCAFSGLNAFDYGLRLDRCGVVGMALPPRVTDGKPADDGAGFYRGEWSHVVDCDFDDCAFPVSPAWMCVGCNFRRCRVSGPATFASRTPLAAEVGVSDDDRPFYDALVAGTTATGDGKVAYARRAAGFDRSPSPLWPLAPAWAGAKR